jgi:conjugal transfer mating pair stabilization protein TraN
VRGDTLSGYWASIFLSGGAADQCFTVTAPDVDAVAGGSTTIYDDAGTHCAVPATGTLVGASGWSLPLSFVQPTMEQHETDVWVDRSAALTEVGGRCTVTTADRCVDGPATKTIDGRAVTRACWSYERTLDLRLRRTGRRVRPVGEQRLHPGRPASASRANAATGLCEITQDTYTCPVAAQTATTASNCPANVYCLGGNLLQHQLHQRHRLRALDVADGSRTRSGRLPRHRQHAGVQGRGQQVPGPLVQELLLFRFGRRGHDQPEPVRHGFRLVYRRADEFADNREFLYQGMQALLLSGGFSGSFTTYGVTVAVNGTALPAGSAVLYSGESMVVAFDPWSLAIAVVIYIVMSMTSCNEDEGKLAMKEGAGLCHTIGTWCSSCIRIFRQVRLPASSTPPASAVSTASWRASSTNRAARRSARAGAVPRRP